MYTTIKNTSEKISSWFLYKGENDVCIYFQHVASDVMFNLTKESYNVNLELSENYIYYIEMIFYNNEWTFSGVTFKRNFDANLILDEKNDMFKIQIGTQFDKKIQTKTKSVLKLQEAIFIKTFKSPILFIESKDLQSILDLFTNSNNIALSENEQDLKEKLKDAKQRNKKKGFFRENNNIDVVVEGNYVVYFNPNSGIEISKDICDIFQDDNNPFYGGEDINKIKTFLFSPVYSTELTNYFIEKHATKFDFFKTGTGKKYLNDFDFLLRFWKNDNYYSKPSITIL